MALIAKCDNCGKETEVPTRFFGVRPTPDDSYIQARTVYANEVPLGWMFREREAGAPLTQMYYPVFTACSRQCAEALDKAQGIPTVTMNEAYKEFMDQLQAAMLAPGTAQA